MENKEKTFKELSSVIKLTAFFQEYTPNINPTGGIYHRINGKSTSKNGKPRELTLEDKKDISSGLKALSIDINRLVRSFDKDIKNGKI